MTLLEANQIKLFMKDRLLLDIEKLQIEKGDVIGLVGRNGCGKTTLLEILSGKKGPESGAVSRNGTCDLLPQLKRTDSIKSGGEVTQEYIKMALASSPALLLADEPTTHLDAGHIAWLEKKLGNWQGALVLVSHDRAFLDALCTVIWELEEGKVKAYKGNYSEYAAQKELERRQHEQAFEKYEKKKRQLEEALALKVKKAERATKAPKRVSLSEARITGAKPYFAKKQKKLEQTAKAIETRLEKLEKVEKAREAPAIKMELHNEESFRNRIIFRVEKLKGQIGKKALWREASFQVRGGDKLAIIGANGSGKTTLLKKLLSEEKGITISPAVKVGYFSQNIDILDVEKSILENVSSDSSQEESIIRTVLARLHFFRDDVHKPVGVLSGGERVKVALAKLFVSDLNTLVLDEPTNFLDLQSVEALESLLKDYSGSVLFVSHDRRLVENVASSILEISNGEIKLFEGTYQEFREHVPKERDAGEDSRLIIETRLTDVLSRLSLEPTPELEQEFQRLLAEKRKLQER
ncbi:Vga family ABC-F type ribosomal protection protein [Bacillus sp. FJAT-27251]|uniref:Vga family ABC-F type ribosomal protection protein n=1 Tax=Bacillus sp. FJAT-27251 TaxID=1684142 RepID=UPI0006A75E26|nr:Vga family ABC-F type ribosomal protection protein [Bacillus sp. FJAT-27251]